MGLVDDIIGVSEVGFKTQIMNTILNLKTAEKTLQFGSKKCKIMVIGKGQKVVRNNPIFVDNWSEKYVQDKKRSLFQCDDGQSCLIHVHQ